MAGAVYLRGRHRYRDDNTISDYIVGCAALDFKEPFPDVPVSELTCLAPVVGLLLRAEEDYERFRPGLQHGECVDVWMLGVHPDYRKRGIAQLLTEACLRHALQKGFRYIILESTGSYSARCAEKAGMTAAIRLVREFQKLPLFFEH